MVNDLNTLENIPDFKPVRIFLPLKNSSNRYRAQAIYQKSSLPSFALTFQPGILPSEDIDTSQTCIISVDMGGPTVSLEAVISEISGSQQLNMTVQKVMTHEQMRDFFRVDSITEVIGKSFKSTFRKDSKNAWQMQGHTIDISGSGILATFKNRPPRESKLFLDITLPNTTSEVVTVLAESVRVIESKDGTFDVAFRFIDISSEDRDKIIGCCLEIQRKLLRLKVKVKNL